MFERILVPLDGSRLAEVVVPYATCLARGSGSEVILIHACSSEQEPYRHMHQVYLDHIAASVRHQIRRYRPKSSEPKVQAITVVGKPVDVISNYVRNNSVTAVVMAASGGSGIKTWMLGSVADKIVRTVNTPILLVEGNHTPLLRGKKKLINRILLPLDGSDMSKIAVPYAQGLAKDLKAKITLFGMAENAQYFSIHVSFIPYSNRTATAYRRMNLAAKRNVREYLASVEEELKEEDVSVTCRITTGMSPAHDIIEQANKNNIDLIVIATRGKSPAYHWAFGSVAEKVLRGCKLPLLLVKEAERDRAIPSFACQINNHREAELRREAIPIYSRLGEPSDY